MNNRTWWERLTSRPFMATVGAAVTAITACIAAWRTDGIPVDDKVNLTIAAITAVTAVAATFTHAETAKDKAAIEAAASTPVTPPAPLGSVVLDDNGEFATQ